MTPLPLSHAARLAAALVLAGVSGPALAQLVPEFGVRVKGAAVTEETRDPDAPLGEDSSETYLDIQPQLHTQFTEDFSHFVRGQLFAPTGEIVSYDQDDPQVVKTYGALREFWFEIGGVTDYPGEVIRLGLQRLRDPDGLWWDRDIETVRWIFDTTLYQFQIGAAKQYDNYRTDDIELPASQKDRAYGFLGMSTQWLPRNFVGLRLAYATDQRELPEPGSQMEQTGTMQDPADPSATIPTYRQPEVRDVGWIGVFLDNKFYEWERGAGVAYRVEVIGMNGTTERAVVDTSGVVQPGAETRDLDALAADAGVRVRFTDELPLALGGAYAYGQGGRDSEGIHDFRQTGLQSNRSRWTGTRTMVNRFNEALQADLTNLRVVSAFFSMPLIDWDASLVAHEFRRDDPRGRTSTDGVLIEPETGNSSDDLGRGWDVVVTRHFRSAFGGYTSDDDRRTNVRLRLSQFTPGDAYADGTPKQNRLMLEGTLWF